MEDFFFNVSNISSLQVMQLFLNFCLILTSLYDNIFVEVSHNGISPYSGIGKYLQINQLKYNQTCFEILSFYKIALAIISIFLS